MEDIVNKCPECSSKNLIWKEGEKAPICKNCGLIIEKLKFEVSNEELNNEEIDKRLAQSELRRVGGCVCLSDDVENHAAEILKNMKKEKVTSYDILKVMAFASVDTDMFKRTIDWYKPLLEKLKKELELD
jgi:transcription initiation factor TFIIIB Brf1 subunit/transcription initiation factor TFIIB